MIHIVTDSSAYMKKGEAETLGVRVVPMTYRIGDACFREGYIDAVAQFFARYSEGADCGTSQTSPTNWGAVFSELCRDGGEVLCITMSSRLSGNYSSAKSAAAEVKGAVSVLDSRTTGAALSYLVSRAVQLAGEGMSAAEIKEQLRNERENCGIIFTVENMEPLKKSGRMGVMKQSIGTFLNIRPILRCEDGLLVSDTLVRGRRAQLEEIIKRIPTGISRLAVQHFGKSAGAEELFAKLTERFPKLRVELREIGPVLGIHLGIGAFGAAFIE